MTIISKHSAVATLAALLATAAVTGCGSSKSSIEPGNENPSAEAEAERQERAEAKSSSTSTSSTGSSKTVSMPASGPLSKEPAVKPPPGPPPSKLETKDLIKGTGKEAKPGETVTVNYVGALYKNGKVFDASWKRHETFSFALGKGQVIVGWDKGVAGMRVGGRRELIIPAAEAYGTRGSPPTIPPNSTLVFVVDLLAA